MTILIFLVILGMLVFVHELGHFLVAKKAGVKVEEFGFGYPPRALKLGKKWDTLFTLNWIPFGGFVKIFGENYEEDANTPAGDDSLRSHDASPGTRRYGASHIPARHDGESGGSLQGHSLPPQKSFTHVSKKWQAAILAAGVAFNVVFAWLLFSLGFMIGLPAAADNSYGVPVKNPVLTIVDVLPDSPARRAGIKTGDKIKELSLPTGEKAGELTPENVSSFINRSVGSVNMKIERGSKTLDFDVTPAAGLVEGKKIIGIDMDLVGTIDFPVHKALYEGSKATAKVTSGTVTGIGGLIKDAVRGKADLSNVAGPVGIVSLVGDASHLGFVYLLTFTALISINLAVINLVPFPALDGGRILFVAIEGITKRSINPKVAGILNTVGFALLILLMLFVTYRDIVRLF